MRYGCEQLLSAGFAVIRMGPGGLGLCLSHVLPFLRLAVIARAGAVIDIRGRVEPHHACSATGCLCHVGGGGLCRTSRSWGRSCSRSRRGCRRCCRSRSASRALRGGWRSTGIGSKPRLYSFMTAACAGLLGSTGVTAVLALAGRAGWRTGRGLRQTKLAHPQSQAESDDATLNLHPNTSVFRFVGGWAQWSICCAQHHSKTDPAGAGAKHGWPIPASHFRVSLNSAAGAFSPCCPRC